MKFSLALLLHNKAFSAGLSISEPISFCLVSVKAGRLLQLPLEKNKQNKTRRIRNEIQEVSMSLASAKEVSVDAAEAPVLSDIFKF